MTARPFVMPLAVASATASTSFRMPLDHVPPSLGNMRSIADDLRAAAEDRADGKALTTAADALESYGRSPGTRAEASRVARILTPGVVDVIGKGLRDAYLEAPHDDPDAALFGSPIENRYALCALLVAASGDDDDLAARATASAADLVPLVTGLPLDDAESLLHIANLLTGSTAAEELAEAARDRLGREPATPGRAWAESLGLNLPLARWEISIEVPGELNVVLAMRDFPGRSTSFSVSMTRTTRWTTMLGNEVARPGTVAAYEHHSDPSIAGEVEVAHSIEDFLRLLRSLQEASPTIALDLAAAKVRASPARVLTAAGKKRIVAWVAGAA